MKRHGIMAAVLLGLTVLAGGADAPSLRLYLPQNVEVDGQCRNLTLGTLGVLGGDEKLVRQASDIPMGRAPWQKEKLLVDRPTILSRLASSGIDGSVVRISGAEKVAVGRKETIFSPQQIVAAAGEWVQAQRPAAPGCAWRLVRQPEEMVVPWGSDVRLRTVLVGKPTAEEFRVTVTASDGPNDLAERELVYRQAYQMQQAVASRDIPIGQAITADNIRIETVLSNQPAEAGWTPPHGMLARRHIPAGAVVSSSAVVAPKPQLVIKRDQMVVMRLEGPGFRLSTVAQALQDGRCGDCIRVLNIDSKRVVTVRVVPDGSVRPVVDEENKP
jgi:flagella basal body P-ring formation protein FlgA